MKTGVLGDKLIICPTGLPGKYPAEGNAVIIQADDKHKPAAPALRLLYRDGKFIIPVVYYAVPPYGEGIVVRSFPIEGTEDACAGSEGRRSATSKGFTENKVQR